MRKGKKRSGRAGGAVGDGRKRVSRGFVVERMEVRRLLSAAVLGYHNDAASTGQDLGETALTPANVNVGSFGKFYSVPVDGQVYAQPLYVPAVSVTTGSQPGVHNVVYVATEHDSLYAIDSDTGSVLWKDSFLVPDQALVGPGTSVTVTTVSSADVNATDIFPEIGITSTPGIDDAMQYLYLVAKSKQVVNGNTGHPYFEQTLYKVNIADGTYAGSLIADTQYDMSTLQATYVSGPTVNDPGGHGWDAINVNGTTVTPFDALRGLQRSAVTLYHGNVYLAFASHGDNGPYHGWVLGYDQATLGASAVFCDTPDGLEGGIWMGAGRIAVDPQGYMYVETGNGTFDTTLDANGFPAGGNYGDSFLKLAVDPATTAANQNINGWGLRVADYFTPYNQDFLSASDSDLGSGGPLILPDSVGNVTIGSAAHPHLLVGAGKEGKLYLIDRDHMGGYSPTTDNVVQELAGLGGVGSYDTPAFYYDGTTARIYYVGVYALGYTFTIGNGILTLDATSTDLFAGPCATTSISANGMSNGIAWDIDFGTGQLRAYDATNLSTELWNSAQAPGGRDSLAKTVKFAVPTVADGRVFVGGFNSLVVYGLLSVPTAPPRAPSGLTAAAASGVQVNLAWADLSDNEDGFDIELSTNGGSTWTAAGTAGANATAYSVTGLIPGATYSFRVRAFNSAGVSDYTNTASATTISPPPVLNYSGGFSGAGNLLSLNGDPPAIFGQNLELTDGGANETTSVFSKSPVKVNFFTTTFSFNLAGAGEGFAFVIQNNSNGALGAGGTALGYGGMGFSVGVKFDLYDNNGEGNGSTGLYVNGASMSDPGNTVKMIPAGVDIRNGDLFQATLKYDGTTLVETVVDTVNQATFRQSYAVNIPSIVGGNNAFIGFTASTDTLTATQTLNSWTYTPLPAPPNAPIGLSVEAASGTELDLSWSESGSTVDHFNIYRGDGAGGYLLVAQVPGAQTFYADGGLTPGAGYSYEVVASNLSGESGIAGPVTAVTPVAPNAPLNFAATNITASSVTLTWASGATNATGYRLMRQIASNNSQLIALLPADATSYTDATLTPGQAYEYVLSAYNIAGPSSGVAVFFQSLPPVPAGVAAVGGSQSVALSWTASAGASGYNIYRGLLPGGEGVAPVATVTGGTSFTDTGLLDGTVYYYEVTAINGWGESPAAGEVAAQTFATNFLNVQAAFQGVVLKRDVDGQHIDWTIGSVAGQLPFNDPYGLTINSFGGNASITLDNSNGNPLPNIVHLNGTFTISGLAGSNPLAGVTFDIGRSTVYFSYGDAGSDASTRGMLKGYLVNAFNGGAWNGAAGDTAGVITSLAASADPNHVSGIGWADSSDGTGVDALANSIELKYTLYGDANLDGTVDIFDLNPLLAHYNKSGDWTGGDFNYDGQVDVFDLNPLLGSYNKNLASLANPRVLSPATGVTTNQTSFTIGGTAPAGSLVKVWLDANLDGVPDSASPIASQQLGASENTFSIAVVLTSNTANHFLVTATDATGKQSAAIRVPTITQDSIAPAVPSTPVMDPSSDTGSSSTDSITAINTPTFTGTADANSAVTLYSDGVAVGSGIADGAGHWSVTVGAGDPAYSGMTLADGAHSITVTATDAAGNTSAASAPLNVVIDTAAPTASETFDGAAGGNGWFTSNGSITLSGSDSGSGVASIVYALDGGSTTPYASLFAVTGDGIHSVVVTTTDLAGNSTTQTFTIKIDATAPTVSETYGGTAGNNGWFVSTGTDTLTASADASGIASVTYALDGGSAAEYTGPFTVSGEGIHTVVVTVTDNAGNLTTDTQTIKIDSVTPATADSVSGTLGSNGWYTSSSVQVSLNATDATSGVAATYYSVDGGNPIAYGGAFAVSGEGSHIVDFFSVDKAGNVEATKSDNIKIDSVGPSVGESFDGTAGSNGWFVSVGNDTITAADAGSGVAGVTYSVDNGPVSAYTAPFALSGDGTHTISVTVTDNAGNTSTDTQTIKIDTARPTISEAFDGTAGNGGWFITGGNDTLTAADALSGVANIAYKLDGGISTPYAGPIAVGGDGTHTVVVTVTDEAGNVTTDSQTIKIDSVAPATTATLSGAVNGKGWYTGGSVQVSLSATDATSGVAATYYRVDGGNFAPYSGVLNISGEGNHTVDFYSADNAGNTEATGTASFKIESLATTASLTGTLGANGWYTSGSVNVTLTATDAADGVAGTYYTVDGGAEQKYSGTFAVSGEGSHSISFHSVDNDGNIEPTQSLDFKIDSVAPLTTDSVSGTQGSAGWYTSSSVQVSLAVADASSGVATTFYSLDGGAPLIYSGALTVSGEGAHSISFHSVDSAGNAEAVETDTIKIDSVKPTTTDSLLGTLGSNGWYTSSSVNVNLSAADATSGVTATYYSIDGGGLLAYDAAFPVSGEGSHSVTFYSVDNAGNTEAVQSDTFKIDSVNPTTIDGLSGTLGTNGYFTSSSVGVTLTASDAASGVAATYYSVDGGSATLYSVPFSVGGEGSHTIRFYSVDNAGNTEITESDTIKIDSVAPLAPSTPVLTAASDSGSSNSDGVTNVKRPTFTGTAEAGSTVTVRDGDTVLGTTTAAMDGSWSFTATADLADGVHLIAATATDAAGNISAASGVLNVTIDTSSPAVSTGGDITVASGTDWTGSVQSFTDLGPAGDVWTATINYGDGTGDQVLVLNGNNYSLEHTWTNSGTDPAIYTVTVKVTDLAGNIGTATFFATINPA